MADFEDEWQESEARAPRQPRVFRANPDRRDDRNWRDGSNQQNYGDSGGGYQNSRDGGGYNNRNFGSTQRNYRDGGGGGYNQRNSGEGGSNQRSFRDDGNQRNFRGGSNQRGYGDGGSSRRNYDDGGSKKVMTVPSDKVGRIIGKGGSKIRELEYESEARVKIGDSNGDTTDVTLSGSDDAISRAESLITELLKEYKPRQN